MQHLLFSGQQKLSDLIHANFKLLQVLPRFDIKLGFGDKTVREVCQQHHVSTHFFLMVCNISTFDHYFPDTHEASSLDIEELTTYLENSHRYYIQNRIPVIKKQLSILADCCDEKEGTLLKRFFDNYSAEVESHLNYEENTVFPYVKNLIRGIKTGPYTIGQFEKKHGNIEDKLHDLKNIIIKYLADHRESELRHEILFNLFELEEDLNKHHVFENKILVPFVLQLERQLK